MSVYERERETAPIFSPVKQISILQILDIGRVCVYMREKERGIKRERVRETDPIFSPVK